MDSTARYELVRNAIQRVLFDPTSAQADEAARIIAAAWQADAQDVHERSYSDGVEGILA